MGLIVDDMEQDSDDAPTKPVSLEDLLAEFHERPHMKECYEAARRLKALAERHQPVYRQFTRRTAGDICKTCKRNWPCPDYVILQGGEVKRG